jgi:hypothetical protein
LSGAADASPIQIATELIPGEEEEVPSMSQFRRLAAQALVVTIPARRARDA